MREGINGADRAKGETQCMIEKNVKVEKRITGEIKGTRVKEKHLGSQGKTKGAASAKGESKMREGAKKMSRWETKDYGGKRKAQAPRRRHKS